VAVASLLLDVERIVNLEDFSLAGKRFALLGSFLVLSWFTLTALRWEDVRGFMSYLIGLGCVLAVGLIVERRTGYNAFYIWAGDILKPIATVAPSPTDIHPAFGSDGRVIVDGPTYHGLAAATMLVVVMPFALVRVLDATTRRTWWLNAAAFALMLAGATATDRKTALLVPVVVVVFIAFYRPKQVLRLAPVGIVALALTVHVASPGALGGIVESNHSIYSSSTTHRVNSYAAVEPDVLAHPILGRGFGTLEPDSPLTFRTNDNEYLDEVWEVGAIGLAAFLWMILAPVVAAHKTIRRRRRDISSLALAGAAGCIAFGVACALFDALAFPQAPYMFFMIAAIATIAAGGPEGNCTPLPELLKRARARAQSGADALTISA
jgi:O-antigen ligase